MAIYSLNGTELLSAYSVQGAELDEAFNLGGNSIFQRQGSQEYDISNVPQYFRSDVLAMADEIDALSDDWQTFMFITDSHNPQNMKHSQSIALYLLANSNADKIILGGDFINGAWNKTYYDEYVAPYLNSSFMASIYAVMGNHETNGAGSYPASSQAIYNGFLQGKSWLNGDLQNNYYYFDDSDRKVRWMFLNTSTKEPTDTSAGMSATVIDAELDWIIANVQLPSAEWSLILFAHIPVYRYSGNITFTAPMVNADDVRAAINRCNGEVIGYFCGHEHVNAISDTGSFWQTVITCDRFENSQWYPTSFTDRVEGTNTEQSVAVISFNTKTKSVLIRGVGGGFGEGVVNSRMNYTYRGAST